MYLIIDFDRAIEQSKCPESQAYAATRVGSKHRPSGAEHEQFRLTKTHIYPCPPNPVRDYVTSAAHLKCLYTNRYMVPTY